MEFIDVSKSDGSSHSGLSLAQKLAKLHTTPAPTPPNHRQSMFGFPRATYCGATKQQNTYSASWGKFFAENRLSAILRQIEDNHGHDKALASGVEAVVQKVVPRLLRNGHLGGRRGISPVLVHGDLWTGNYARGTISGWNGPEELVFDPSACYAHSEFEVSMMRMWGGFNAGFFHEYHRLVPKTDPKEEYEDRMLLYQLYHYLNHFLLFTGGYKDDALERIEKLLQKYG
jgi:protein-ribulosamine 3-kinase